MGVVLDDSRVYVVMTEVNGYKNLYGHVLYADRQEAERVACDAADGWREYDEVYVTEWAVV